MTSYDGPSSRRSGPPAPARVAGTGIVGAPMPGRRPVRRRPVSTDSGGVEHDAEAAAAGVDDAGRAELLELLRRVLEGFAGRLGGRREHVAGPGARLGGTTYGGIGGGAGDGQDRALDRLPDGGIAGVGGLDHGLGHHGGVAFVRGRPVDARRERAEHLAEDDAAVAARPEQGPAPECGQGGREVGLLRHGLLDGVAGGAHREVHVGARVAVRHGVHVERVDLLPRLGERVDGDVHEALDDTELDAAAGRCFHGLPRARWIPG